MSRVSDIYALVLEYMYMPVDIHKAICTTTCFKFGMPVVGGCRPVSLHLFQRAYLRHFELHLR